MPRRAFVLPSFGDYKPKVRGNAELETAKTILWRAGRIVYNASVTDGPSGRGKVEVDGRDYLPSEVVALAVNME